MGGSFGDAGEGSCCSSSFTLLPEQHGKLLSRMRQAAGGHDGSIDQWMDTKWNEWSFSNPATVIYCDATPLQRAFAPCSQQHWTWPAALQHQRLCSPG